MPREPFEEDSVLRVPLEEDSVLQEIFDGQFCATGAPSRLLKAILCNGKPAVRPTPRFAASWCIKIKQKLASVQNRVSTQVGKPRGPLEEDSVLRSPLEEDSVLRGPLESL